MCKSASLLLLIMAARLSQNLICTSVNHVICHGIPGDKQLKDGDSVNIDVTVIKDGYHGDTSKMFVVGKAFYND